MSFIKGFDFSGNSSLNGAGILRVCHSCHGDSNHGATLSICGSIGAPSNNGKWVV